MTQTNTASATSIEINDVAPIPAGERHGKAWHLFTVWSSPNLQSSQTVFVGALGVLFFGLNLTQADSRRGCG
jgi:NCS1 family nucleobase:cation symporter-1